MIRKRFYFMMLVSITAIFLYACSHTGTVHQSDITVDASENIAQTGISSADGETALASGPEDTLADDFIEDCDMPDEIRGVFKRAVNGDKESMQWLSDDADSNNFLGVVLHRAGVPREAEVLCYSIGMIYYGKIQDPLLEADKVKAFKWYQRASVLGDFSGAILAGDMAKRGDGIPVNERDAFMLYSRAFDIEKNGNSYERLALCYQSGIGTDADMQKAKEYIFYSMMGGNVRGYYQYLLLEDSLNQEEKVVLSKTVSSLDFTIGYFYMVYEGRHGYSINTSNQKVLEFLNHVWEDGTDPAVIEIEKSLRSNEYFPETFVEACIRTSYAYACHAFVDTYGIRPNRGYEDGKKIKFARNDYVRDKLPDDSQAVEDYLKDKSSRYYEKDFDGDGENEIGITNYISTGGAPVAYGFNIYKKNDDGLYDFYAQGPDCTMGDVMHIVEYGGRIYFLKIAAIDEKNSYHAITAEMIDKEGKVHRMHLDALGYQLKRAVDYSYEQNAPEDMGGFKKHILEQSKEAVRITKKPGIYHPGAVHRVLTDEKLSAQLGRFEPEESVYFSADIENNGAEKFIWKLHATSDSKYYDDFNLFQIYESKEALLNDLDYQSEIEVGDSYGLYSSGNVYDAFPIMGSIVQFWCEEWEGVTYCLALTKNEQVYTLQVYKKENGKAIPVYHCILLDEAQEMQILFS